jgi:hypothetical protein
VHRALFQKDTLYDLGTVPAVQSKAFSQVTSQSIAVLQYNQGAGSCLGESKTGLHDQGDINCPGLIRTTQKEANGICLDENFTDLVTENHYTDQNCYSPDSLEKPACEYQASGLGNTLKNPEEQKSEHDLKSGGSTKEKKESVYDEADDQNVDHILPLEGKKDVEGHMNCYSTSIK